MVSVSNVIVIDLVNRGSSHKLFNSEILNFISTHSKVLYIGYNSHQFYLNKNESKFDIQSIILKNYRSSIIRIVYFVKILIEILSSKKFRSVYILALNTREIQFLLFLSFFLGIKKDIHLFLHSNLEYIVRKRKITARLLLGSKLQKYVLGEWILKKIVLFNKTNNIFNLSHPISNMKNESFQFKTLSFVFTGVCTQIKGFDLFCIVWNHFIEEENVEFVVAGNIDLNYYNFLCDKHIFLKEYPISQQFISEGDYERKCLNATHIILPQKEEYSFISSGSFLDCFIYLKPVITLENEMSLYYFQKYGDIGYLCKNEDEMLQIIRQIIRFKDLSEYNQKIQNLKKAREKYSENYKISLNKLRV